MGRDFMGLSVKRETPDEIIDSAPARSLAMQWSFSNKTSALPQLLSFQGVQEEKPKTGFDSLASTGLVTITTTEAFDSDQKSYSSVVQKNVVPEKQGGLRYRMTTYPTNHLDTHNIHQPAINQANVTVSPAISTAIHQSFIATAGTNLISSVASPQPLAAIPMATPVQVLPSNSPVVGTTDLRIAPKISTAPAQLTIFYAGSVCVYDNISPEKAQAIMLLAGNSPPMTSITTLPAAPVQASMPRPSVLDGFIVSQNYGTMPHISSPVPITAISMSQSPGGSGCNNRTTTVKPAGVLISSLNKVEPLKVVNSLGSVPATLLSSSTVPQFRRKSLARFLERRKERRPASPYADKQPLDCSTPGAGSTSLSVNSSGSCPVPATK